jgi:penicillin-binding protein 1A
VPPVLSITLGTPTVSVLEMADAYLTFATRGTHVAPNVISQVTDADGNVLWEPEVTRTKVMDEHETDVVTYALEQVVQRGTGTRAALGTPVAGKTGTTQSYGDAWFVGYTPGMSTAVWLGFPEGQDHELRGVHGINVTGGSLPAQIWHEYMAVATEDERYRGEFHDPGDLGGQLVPSSGRVHDGAGETTTSSTTSSSVPDDASTTSSTTDTTEPGDDEGGGETTTTTTAVEEPSTTTSTTAAPSG